MEKKDDKKPEGAGEGTAEEKPNFVDAAAESPPDIDEDQATDDGGKSQDGKNDDEKLQGGGDEALEPPQKKSPVDEIAENSEKPDPKPGKGKGKGGGYKSKSLPLRILSHFNVYLIIFVLFVVIGAGTIGVMALMGRKEEAKNNAALPTTELTAEDLQQLRVDDTTVGDPKQTLTVESNAIFTGKVLIRSGLDVAGDLKVGGGLSIPSINVAGDGTFTRISVNTVDISGALTVGGNTEIQGSLNVTGEANFGGALNAPRINISTLAVAKFTAIGTTPAKTNGPALGSGGTSSVSGTDSAGSVTINTGGGTSAGILATITFTQKFNLPHVVITPNGPGGSNIGYYVTNISQNGFAIATSTAAPVGQSFKFEYIVFDQ